MEKERWKRLALLSGGLALAAVICGYGKTPDIVVNEVCSNNFSAGHNENGEYADCIELYNPGRYAVTLDGYFLTDDEKEPEKYSLEGLVVPAKGYTLVWLDKECGLRISKDGDRIFLADANRGIYLDQAVIPKLSYDTSYGRVEDGKAKWSIMSPTLGSANDEASLLPAVSLEKPVFETESGFYEEAFSLHLYSRSGEKIYYTLDGSEPDKDSFVYEEPLWIADNSGEENRYASRSDLTPTKSYIPDFPVDKAVVVRAMCYNPATGQASDIVTQTYFIGYRQRTEYAQMPVISLTADPGDLFDNQTGIYGNGAKYEEYLAGGGRKDGEILDQYLDENGETKFRYMASNAFEEGREWERKAVIAYFDENRSHIFTQSVGIRIAGNSTCGAPQKSLNVFARDIYEDGESLPYDFFGEGYAYSSIKLRNGGGNTDKVKFLDAFLEEASRKRNISIQGARPCVVFLNGEYWGIYHIRERYDAQYPAARFGLEPDGVMVVKAGNAVTAPKETLTAYQYMIDVVTECELVYDDTYALASSLVDIQSLIDYCCIHLYLDNRDVAFGYNTALWRTVQEGTAYSDGKWRFMLYDMDDCIFPDSNVWDGRENWMAEHPLLNEPAVLSLLENESFRRQFCISFMDIANETFSYERMHSMLAEWGSLYERQIVKDHKCFYDSAYSREDFWQEVAAMDDFFKGRFGFAMESLAKTFQLEGELTRVKVGVNDTEGGMVTVNTAPLEECSVWEGYYYSDFPVTVMATPREGYRFVSWQGDVSGTEAEVSLSLEDGAVSLQAVFEKDA